MDPNLLIGLGSLVFTIIGSVAAVLAIRRNTGSVEIPGTVDPAPAFRLLGRRVPRAHRDVLQILSRFIFVSHHGRVTVGALDQFEISLFLDLFSACTFARYRRSLASVMARHIRSITRAEKPVLIAVPKEGNVLLADAVARKLRIGLIVVRTLVPAIRFGDPVEGKIAAGSCVIIVDDIASDGELLVRTAGHVRSHGGRVSLCLCMVERMDGNSRERLAVHDVRLYAPIRLNEGTLRELAQLPRRHEGYGVRYPSGSSTE